MFSPQLISVIFPLLVAVFMILIGWLLVLLIIYAHLRIMDLRRHTRGTSSE